MKSSIASLWVAVATLLLIATTAVATPAPAVPAASAAARSPVNPAQVTLLDGSTCGPRMYSCRACTNMEDLLQLCYEQICGNYVIVNCDPCAPRCSLPPS